jgi:ABC-type sugar transport system ATPase subunit
MNNNYEYELELKNISKSFGGVKALSNVDLNLKKGTVHSIVGENGAGKSTMMKIISGAIQQNSGEIYLKGKKVNVNNPRDAMNKGISIVYQEPVFYPYLSVMENFFSGKEIITSTGNLNWKKMKEETYQALEKFDLPGEISVKTMSELTIGTQQMVLIAKAIYHDATILILDEPTAGLDPQMRKELIAAIVDLQEKFSLTIILISHRMEEIAQLSDRVFVLDNGKLSLTGSPIEVFSNYEYLTEIGLGVPEITEVLHRIKAKGLDVNTDVFRVDQAKEEILKVMRG